MARRTTRSRAATGPSPAATASASSSATVGNSCSIWRSRCAHLRGEPVLAGQHAEHERHHAEDQQRHAARRRAQPHRAGSRAATRERDQPPDHLLDAELAATVSDRSAALAAVGGRSRSADTRSSRSAAEPQREPNTPANAVGGRTVGRRRRGRGRSRDVGQHPRIEQAYGAARQPRPRTSHSAGAGDARRARHPTSAGVTTAPAARRAAGRCAPSAGRRRRQQRRAADEHRRRPAGEA